MTFRVHIDETFVRTNLRFSVRIVEGVEKHHGAEPLSERRPQRWRALTEALATTSRPTIVYTMSRREADVLAAELSQHLGQECLSYHAEVSRAKRRLTEERFLSGDLDCIVATNAFGMGVDKADVHSVIHWQVPATPEALYQEAGRAGRGAMETPAEAVLLFHDADLDHAYRTIRRDVPTRWEIVRADLVLRELADLQRRSVVTVTDEDLARLATLRPAVQQRVVLAHLERAGLVRELDRLHGARSLRRTELPVSATSELEREILRLVDESGECTGIAAGAILGVGGARATRQVWSAVNALERRGILQRCRDVSARLLDRDAGAAIEGARRAANSVWRELKENHDERGQASFHRRLGAHDGDAAQLRLAIEVLAGFGLVEVRHEGGDDTIPAVRMRRSASIERLKSAFKIASCVAGVLARMPSQSVIALSHLTQETGLSERDVLSGLTLLHLVGAASVDLRSWQDDSPSVARVMEILAVPDRDALVAEAIEAGTMRARTARLRLETLRRYATIERGDDDIDTDPYQAFLEQYLTEPDFLERVASDTTAELCDQLTATQRNAVQAAKSQPITVLAGPGTGKTRTVVSRIAYRVRSAYVLPERILAITFTRSATEEMRARLAQVGVRGVDVRTLDSLGWRIVRENWAALGLHSQPEIVPDQHSIVRSVAPEANAAAEVAALNLAKNRRRPSEDPIHRAYQSELDRRNLVDFGDVKELATRFLNHDRRARSYLEAVDEVFVDEFQDLSPLQVDLADAISAEAHLTLVGDPRQAIFEWNGAAPDELLRRQVAASHSFDLVENFRSTSKILDVANRVIRLTLPQLPPISPARKSDAPPVTQTGFPDESEMLDHLAQTVTRWLGEGIADAEIAVLAYKNLTVSRVTQALRSRSILARGVGLPKLASTHAYSVARRVLAADVEPDPAESPLDQFDRIGASVAVVEALESGSADEAAQNMDDWERLRAEVDNHRRSGLTDLADALTAISRAKEGPASRPGVTVTTIARAKGLEWTAVALTDVGADSMADWSDNAERCRCVYVGVTRAKTHLDISWTGSRTKWLS